MTTTAEPAGDAELLERVRTLMRLPPDVVLIGEVRNPTPPGSGLRRWTPDGVD